MVWKIQSRLPVRTSNPRTYPLLLRMLFGVMPSLNADFSRSQIRKNVLIVIQLQVHFTVVSEGRNPHAGLRVQTDETKARRHIKNSLFLAVGPIRKSAARELPRGGAA